MDKTTKDNLKIINISKSFNSLKVLQNISFDASGGEIVGIFGENGSGKTTLLKIISGIIKPDSGDVKLNDENISKARSQFLFVGHEHSLYKYMSISENLMFWGKIWGRRTSQDDIKSALSFFGIEDLSTRLVGELSQGTRKKIALAKFFIVDPKVLVLDEPLSNLDDDGKRKVIELISFAEKIGKIVIFSSPEEYDILRPTKKLILRKSNSTLL